MRKGEKGRDRVREEDEKRDRSKALKVQIREVFRVLQKV
jgi:hypothetical protein